MENNEYMQSSLKYLNVIPIDFAYYYAVTCHVCQQEEIWHESSARVRQIYLLYD